MTETTVKDASLVRRFAPFSRETLAEPYGFYTALRAEAPVWQDPSTGIFIVSSAADVRAVATRPKLFSSGTREAMRARKPALRAVEALYAAKGWPRPGTLGHSDPPVHGKYRRMVASWFAPTRMRALTEHVDTVVCGLLDELLVDHRNVMDFHTDFSVPMPIRVFAGQLGVPLSDVQLFQRFGDAGIAAIDFDVAPEKLVELAHVGIEQQHYFAEKVDLYRRTPADLLISEIANARDDNGKLFSLPEILSMVDILVLGGTETTTNALSLSMWQLCRTVGLEARLRLQAEAIAPFVEESLRFLSPVQFINRIATEDVVLGGVHIPQGARVMMNFASANRDEVAFANASHFDIDRGDLQRHVAFGIGIKHCIGAPLARLELQVGWTRLIERLHDMRLEPAQYVPQMSPHPIARGPTSLPIRFTDSKHPMFDQIK